MNKKALGAILLCATFLITAAFGLYVRFYPLRTNLWSDNTEKATALVIAKIRMTLAQQIVAQYPDLPDAQRNSLIEEKFAKTLHDESTMVKNAIRTVSANLEKEMPDSKGRLYLQEADGYYYYDLTENIVNTGSLGGPVKGSKFLHEQMGAPFGFWQPLNLHPYVGFIIYKIIDAFKPGTPIMTALCYTGPVLSLIALAAFLWCCRTLSLGPLATAAGAFYFYLAPIFIKRSTFAWNDDDSYNLIFPILIFAVVFEALKKVKTNADGLKYGIIASVLFTVYSLFWHGWGFTFALITVSGFLILAANVWLDRKFIPYAGKKKSEHRPLIPKGFAALFGAILAGSLVLVSILFGAGDFLKLFQEGFSGLQKLTVNELSLWPNLFVAVGELKPTPPGELIHMTGNFFWWLCAGAGLVWGLMDALKRHDRIRIFSLIILTVTLLADIKLTLSAERFTLLALIPVALLGSVGFDLLAGFLRQWLEPNSRPDAGPKLAEWIAGLIILAAAVFAPVRSINAEIPSLLNPIFNETWENALLDIKTKTPQDSIITSWWPPGHFIKAVADRRVTFDGATITKNVEAYWVANMLLTSDEREAAGILRMLNTGGTKALEQLESSGMKTSDAVSLLHFIVPQNRKSASEFLKGIMPADKAETLLSLTHGDAPPSYILIYTELMEKSIGLQFVAKWNFRKMEELNKNPQAIKSLPPANSPAFFEYLWSIMGTPYRYSEALISIQESDGKVGFTEGVTLDLASMRITIQSPKYGSGIPASIVYLDGDKVVEKTFSNHNLSYSVVLFKENTKYYCRLMDTELAQSLLTKMYFFHGKGLELFSPLSLQKSMTGRDEILVFGLNREKL